MKNVAIYRVLYGEDFIKESIESILPHVDKVLVIKSEKPWGNTSGVLYKGSWVDWPDKFDNSREIIQELSKDTDKIEIIDDYWPTPKNQLTHIVNDIALPRFGHIESVVFIEPDHVFSKDQAEKAFSEWDFYSGVVATTQQIEMWRTIDWRIPERPNRTSVVFHRVNGHPMGETGFNGAPEQIKRLSGTVHNFGFCMSEKVMYWKHLTALAFSEIIKDSPPNPEWYEKTWLSWDPIENNKNLEISLGYEWVIPNAIPYNFRELPETIKVKYKLTGF